jgi:hypothetical protein
MEAKETINPDPNAGTPLPAEQASDVAGGDCGTTITIGPVTVTGSTPGDAIISLYDGAVDATSHVIETVAKSF